jgi:hypothetical protein
LGTGALGSTTILAAGDQWLPALDLQISDRINVRRLPNQATAEYQADSFVEGWTEEITSKTWILDLSLSEA